jgi:YD repeat-containing protein
MTGFQYYGVLWGLLICAGLVGAGSASAESYNYDDLGRLISVTLDDGTVVTYKYDPAGNRTSVATVGMPTAVDDTGVQVDLNTPKSIDVLDNDSDPNGDQLSITAVTPPTNGTASIIDVSGEDWVKYTPNTGYLGTDSFTYTITDGQSSVTANVSVAVVTDNDPPVAVNDAVSTNEDQAKTINPLSNDSDPESQSLSLGSITAPSNGSAVKSGNSVIYTPAANFSGSDSFTYNVSDGALTSSATVSITINAVNDTPVANNDSITTNEDTAKTFNPRINDTDVETPSSSLTISAKTNGSKGTVAIVSSGAQLRYTPNANANGSDSFTYTIKDGSNATDTATVSVAISPVNDNINAINDSRSTNEDTATTFDPRTNDIEPDGQTVTITGKTNGSKGTVAITNSGTRLRYTPNSNVNGSDSFTYTVSDGHSTDTATVSMTINAVNDPPRAVNDTYSNVTRNAWKVMPVTANDSDPEGQSFTITSVTSIAGAQTQIIYNGAAIRYRCGCSLSDDALTYTITDSGGASATGRVTVYIANGGGSGGGGPPL